MDVLHETTGSQRYYPYASMDSYLKDLGPKDHNIQGFLGTLDAWGIGMTSGI